ncbi:MAG: DUF4864 domain-containing protein [Pseudomonadota bacterium]
MKLHLLLGAVMFALSFAVTPAAHAQSEQAPAAQRSGAQAVINSQINAFKTREHDKAFSHAAPNLQKIFGDTDRFIGMVKSGYGAIYGAQNWSFGRSGMQGETLYQEVLITGPNGREWLALYTMKQGSDGVWRIHGVQMKQGQAQST